MRELLNDVFEPTTRAGALTTLTRWIRSQTPDLVVYGGDVYNNGTPAEFDAFFNQMDRKVSDLCEVAGNHDWSTHDLPDRVPTQYEAFWRQFPPPLSQQPINLAARGSARYDHVKDIGGWRLIFVDTGRCKKKEWPMADETRRTWLRRVMFVSEELDDRARWRVEVRRV